MKIIVSLGLVMALLIVAQNATANGGTSVDRAMELLNQARAALGGEAAIKGVQSLSIAGKLRRVTDNQDQSGEIKLDILLPDKLKKTETVNLIAGIELTLVTTLNGDQAWKDSKSSSPGNAQVTIMRPGGQGQQPVAAQEVRAELARHLLALLLTPPSSFPMEYSYAGDAEAPDGKADVVDAKGPAGFAARLFLDKKTHRPLMLSYRGLVGRVSTMRASGDRSDIDKLVKEAQANAVKQEAEIQLHFSDYRVVDGILLPHHMTRAANGKISEEWEITKFKINPQGLRADRFQKP
ncbi:MAG: hypothetical protein DMF60_20505 [Acidobacteria bacterium]|nr:MAG: hypothetical protein DMF60_20505 [Acidobacteriota bacterium]